MFMDTNELPQAIVRDPERSAGDSWHDHWALHPRVRRVADGDLSRAKGEKLGITLRQSLVPSGQ